MSFIIFRPVGSDIQSGEQVLSRGELLGPGELGVLGKGHELNVIN